MTSSFAERFKAGFRRHAAGVAIVAASTESGPVGATVSSVTSVSASPPMLSFSMSRSGRSGPRLVESSQLVVHVLAASQAKVAAAFADRSAPRFTAEQGWTLRKGRPPVLDGAVAAFYGRAVRVLPAGEAWLVLVEVDDVSLGEGAAPLLHHDRRFWSLGEALGPSAATAPSTHRV
ncbi:flavin reductase family protein [Nonomuraea gerenzanensis]|uniref:NADH-FMN oxidoreductase n=1 Tax=Nonomuraea gerenzanensis TaxID=93944 RepID=A0A1M4EBT1_9ACTN|nr:flavin reductase family protein [Nonomuraea gerenzanensis]UBU18247.1 flavin reductase family protein [Nonomuraea gerenzanensis]SBO96063.1 NADH-FMN oxidoreductase [Nonomuraea gerenzanensis]